MKNSKGITLASLVVMIASIILLASMAIGFGYRHLKETKKADETYFKEVLSNAVTKRENNHTVSSIENPRIGYEITSADTFKEIVNKYIPELKSVNEELLYERGNWYIVDNKTAEKLGVKDSEKYIDVFDEESTEKMTVTLVDYISGSVYIFEINGSEITEIKDDISGDNGGTTPIKPSDGHEHDYNIPAATCTEDRKCLICGYVIETALGHDYDGTMAAEPIDEEFHYKKECKRCHAKGGYERHKDLDNYAFYESGDGTWYHYNGCSVCGWPKTGRNYEACTTVWKSVSEEEHVKECKVCKHQEHYKHDLKYVCLNEQYHEQVCTICGYVKIKYEPHEGERYCDKCGCEIIRGENPVLTKVILKNKEYPESKYVTNGETIQLIFTADKTITDAQVTICGYGGDNIKYIYSDDKLTCTAELFIDSNIIIPQNTEVYFTINCKSITTGAYLQEEMVYLTDDEAYLIYDSVPPTLQYILKDSY